MLNIVLFGPPGSGKGTQAEKIISKYKLTHISTGDMIRAEIASKSKIGLEIKPLVDKGNFAPDDIIIKMIENKISNQTSNGFVFDGFPRTVYQAKSLDELLKKYNSSINVAISLHVDEEELTKRILKRGKTSGRVDDQSEEIVKNRVMVFKTKTEPLTKYYDSQNKLKEIEGEGNIEEIFKNISIEIDKELNN